MGRVPTTVRRGDERPGMVMAEEGLGERSRKVAEGRRGERLGAVVAPEERGGGE